MFRILYSYSVAQAVPKGGEREREREREKTCPNPTLCVTFRNKLFLYGEEFIASRTTHEL